MNWGTLILIPPFLRQYASVKERNPTFSAMLAAGYAYSKAISVNPKAILAKPKAISANSKAISANSKAISDTTIAVFNTTIAIFDTTIAISEMPSTGWRK